MIIRDQRIASDWEGFAAIARIHADLKNESDETIFFDCGRLKWLDANMCAPLGAVLRSRSVRLQNLSTKIGDILGKNGFLPGEWTPDTYGTTIAFRQFDIAGSEEFESYVENHFRGKGLPSMTAALIRQFRRSIFELFENAVTHSDTHLGIFACGQYFPQRHRLHFCVADRGIGIPQNVRQFLGQPLDATDAIEWALSEQNTTRRVTDGVPGGLGLKLIREFIEKNSGAIRVASEDGYWCVEGTAVRKIRLPASFPGTAVDIEINTADTKSYMLSGEIDPKDIF